MLCNSNHESICFIVTVLVDCYAEIHAAQIEIMMLKMSSINIQFLHKESNKYLNSIYTIFNLVLSLSSLYFNSKNMIVHNFQTKKAKSEN